MTSNSASPAPTALFPPPGSKAELEESAVFSPKFGADGTMVCVTIDADSQKVLMVGHMNAESLKLTIETGEGWYFSRSRNELWHKGATSGNIQRVVSLATDCDQDAILMHVRVDGHGATCHTGRESCFYRSISFGHPINETRLTETDSHRHFDPASVYVKK